MDPSQAPRVQGMLSSGLFRLQFRRLAKPLVCGCARFRLLAQLPSFCAEPSQDETLHGVDSCGWVRKNDALLNPAVVNPKRMGRPSSPCMHGGTSLRILNRRIQQKSRTAQWRDVCTQLCAEHADAKGTKHCSQTVHRLREGVCPY